MATAGSIGLSGSPLIDGVLSGVRWIGPLSYAFPASASEYGVNYPGDEPSNGFASLNAVQQNAVRNILDSDYSSGSNADGFSVDGFTNLQINLTGSVADVMLGQSAEAKPTAYAYYPSSTALGGDVWLGTQTGSSSMANPIVGNYAYMSIEHEIGHALGLKHGHSDPGLSDGRQHI